MNVCYFAVIGGTLIIYIWKFLEYGV